MAYRQLNALNMLRAKQEMMKNGASSLASLGKLAMSCIQHREAHISAKILGSQVLLNGCEDAQNANFDSAKAYMNSIGGGTDQIQRNIIAERVLGLPKSQDVSRDIAFKGTKSG